MAMRQFIRHITIMLVVLWCLPGLVMGADTAPAAAVPPPDGWLIGPIPELTTGWHPAPAAAMIPMGRMVLFRQLAPADAQVAWRGATEVARDATGSSAACPLDAVGDMQVQAVVTLADGTVSTNRTHLTVADFPVAAIQVGAIQAAVTPIAVDEEATNEETMWVWTHFRSIAALHSDGAGGWSTSVQRRVHLRAAVQPRGVAPVLEWRSDGVPIGLGGAATHAWGRRETGTHQVEVGPPLQARSTTVTTYDVYITSPQRGDPWPDGEPITFEAMTIPGGFESQISWLASTKYGTAKPVRGVGANFTVQFNDTLDPGGEGHTRWVGVQADNEQARRDKILDKILEKLAEIIAEAIAELIEEIIQEVIEAIQEKLEEFISCVEGKLLEGADEINKACTPTDNDILCLAVGIAGCALECATPPTCEVCLLDVFGGCFAGECLSTLEEVYGGAFNDCSE